MCRRRYGHFIFSDPAVISSFNCNSFYFFLQIALTGHNSERRNVGEWFGPNTMGQVLKKICHDKRMGLSVHVAMDSGWAVTQLLYSTPFHILFCNIFLTEHAFSVFFFAFKHFFFQDILKKI